MIAAVGRNRELGKGPDLLWPIPADLKRFKEITTGHSIIMGSKTFESIGRPLPNRTNIVVTRDPDLEVPDVMVVRSLEDAIDLAGDDEVFIIGGGQIYASALPLADKLYMTLIDAEEPEADIFFPEFEHLFPKKTIEGEGAHEGINYTWVNFEK